MSYIIRCLNGGSEENKYSNKCVQEFIFIDGTSIIIYVEFTLGYLYLYQGGFKMSFSNTKGWFPVFCYKIQTRPQRTNRFILYNI